MWTLIFIIMMLLVFGKILTLAIKMAWGITKIVVFVILLPIVLIALVFAGLIYIAIPVLAIIGLVTLIKPHI